MTHLLTLLLLLLILTLTLIQNQKPNNLPRFLNQKPYTLTRFVTRPLVMLLLSLVLNLLKISDYTTKIRRNNKFLLQKHLISMMSLAEAVTNHP
jgi:hypothetical protein